MDRNPSPPAPKAQPSTVFVFATTENFMEMVQRLTGLTAPTNAATAAQHVAIVPPTSALEPVQRQQVGLALQLTLSQPLPWENLGPCVTNLAPDILSLATSSSSASTLAEKVEMEEAGDVEMEDAEEVEAIREGRFYLLPAPQNTDEPKLLNLFPLVPSSSEGN